jgi:SPRY domain
VCVDRHKMQFDRQSVHAMELVQFDMESGIVSAVDHTIQSSTAFRHVGGDIGGDRAVRADRPFPYMSPESTQPFTVMYRTESGWKARLSLIAYFEITIEQRRELSANEEKGPNMLGYNPHTDQAAAMCSIGVATSRFRMANKQPGWDHHSFGYHGDDGNVYHAQGIGIPYGAPFSAGDTVGCLLDYFDNTIYFTKNGEMSLQQPAFAGVHGSFYPVVGIDADPTWVVRMNFGQEPFKFDVAKFEDEMWSQSVASFSSMVGRGAYAHPEHLPPAYDTLCIHNTNCDNADLETGSDCNNDRIIRDARAELDMLSSHVVNHSFCRSLQDHRVQELMSILHSQFELDSEDDGESDEDFESEDEFESDYDSDDYETPLEVVDEHEEEHGSIGADDYVDDDYDADDADNGGDDDDDDDDDASLDVEHDQSWPAAQLTAAMAQLLPIERLRPVRDLLLARSPDSHMNHATESGIAALVASMDAAAEDEDDDPALSDNSLLELMFGAPAPNVDHTDSAFAQQEEYSSANSDGDDVDVDADVDVEDSGADDAVDPEIVHAHMQDRIYTSIGDMILDAMVQRMPAAARTAAGIGMRMTGSHSDEPSVAVVSDAAVSDTINVNDNNQNDDESITDRVPVPVTVAVDNTLDSVENGDGDVAAGGRRRVVEPQMPSYQDRLTSMLTTMFQAQPVQVRTRTISTQTGEHVRMGRYMFAPKVMIANVWPDASPRETDTSDMKAQSGNPSSSSSKVLCSDVSTSPAIFSARFQSRAAAFHHVPEFNLSSDAHLPHQ